MKVTKFCVVTVRLGQNGYPELLFHTKKMEYRDELHKETDYATSASDENIVWYDTTSEAKNYVCNSNQCVARYELEDNYPSVTYGDFIKSELYKNAQIVHFSDHEENPVEKESWMKIDQIEFLDDEGKKLHCYKEYEEEEE